MHIRSVGQAKLYGNSELSKNHLKEGDIILKGANALDMSRRQAAILIGHPKAGTIGIVLQAVALIKSVRSEPAFEL